MKLKSYLASLGLAFILGLALLPAYTLATGEDETDTSDQNQEQDQNQNQDQDQGQDQGDEGQDQKPDDDPQDSSDDSPNNSFIGGGMNNDGDSSQAQAPSDPSGNTGATKPTPTTPKPTTPLPTLPSILPGQSAAQVSSNSRPQSSSGALVTEPLEVTPEESSDASEQELSVLPTVPNDNIAPTQVETPLTGSQEASNINLAAIALLFVAGVTIMSAGIFVTIMQKVANRAQRAL